MSHKDELPEEENFSDDPEENLRLQNEFLKLKMMAESGAEFGGDGDLPADIENQFLKKVMEFEKLNTDYNPKTIHDVLGKPVFEDEKELDEKKFKIEYVRLKDLLHEFSIDVYFKKERDERFKYHFITKELFDHQTIFMPVKGMTTCFMYEEFHPDHEAEISEITHRFLNDFFERNLNPDTDYINKELIEPEGNLLSREDLIKRFYSMYEVAIAFENTSFKQENINFEIKESGDRITGMGFSEGHIEYEMIFTEGLRKKISGPFKIYFAREYDVWAICFFYLAGYNIHPKNE